MATTIKTDNGVAKIMTNIRAAYEKRKVAALVICEEFKVLAVKTIRESQGMEQNEGQFWTNRTTDAIKGIYGFTVDYRRGHRVGFGLAHTMGYGKHLEGFDKDGNKTGTGDRYDKEGNRIGRYGALERTIKVLTPFFLERIQKVFHD